MWDMKHFSDQAVMGYVILGHGNQFPNRQLITWSEGVIAMFNTVFGVRPIMADQKSAQLKIVKL